MFHYFGYGSNMHLASIRAKGVEPLSSARATLRGWRLAFNVKHFFRHEGGVANILPAQATDVVQGVVHACEDDALARLDAAEACGYGYDRVQVEVFTADSSVRATAYVGMPSFLDDACLPSRRYLNILCAGAEKAGIDTAYLDRLRQQPTHPRTDYPPFVFPTQPEVRFNAETLAASPQLTALAGAVFDMSAARAQHEYLKQFFGGRDMTLFHLKRMDSSDGSETQEDIRSDRLSPAQRRYLNEYLHEYSTEYAFAGRFDMT
ncbi:MAG TPA: gamma-glutamylcyclotransferase [Prosthecobacter sp.]|nr:gamma-glutamylcyclotransferase [Prosthecobacter sp.]